MGREIIIEAKKGKKELYSDFVCGREPVTGYIANLVYNSSNKKVRETGTLTFYYGDKKLKDIKSEIQEYADKDNFEIEKAKATIDDLKIARRNSHTVKDFTEFSELIDDTYEWLEEEGSSIAQSILDMLAKSEDSILRHYLESHSGKTKDIIHIRYEDIHIPYEEFKEYKINIIVSE